LEKYKKLIEERRSKNMFRSLSSFSFDDYIDFCSNDYLGLSKISFDSDLDYQSATGSRLISGNSSIYNKVEHFLAEFFEAESALIFNSGYDANIGLLSSLPQKGDTVIYDELIHASIRDGIRLSNAKSFKFKHNDLEDLKAKISKSEGELFLVVESVYSMDGDFAPLKEVVDICNKSKVKLIVDEAHSGGIFGVGGRGLVVELGLQNDVFARVLTFGKAYGAHGAVVLSNELLKEFLVNYARSFIYTTGLPNLSIERIVKVVAEGKYSHQIRKQLFDNIKEFKRRFSNSELYQIDSDSPIQTLILPGNSNVKAFEEFLLNEKIWCKAILSPTVSEGKERLRVSIHAFNTKRQLDLLETAITKFL
jgi:8-amino-7-oxononanoate synthase